MLSASFQDADRNQGFAQLTAVASSKDPFSAQEVDVSRQGTSQDASPFECNPYHPTSIPKLNCPRNRTIAVTNTVATSSRSDFCEIGSAAQLESESASCLHTPPTASEEKHQTINKGEAKGFPDTPLSIDYSVPASLVYRQDGNFGLSTLQVTPQVDVVKEQVEYFFASQPGIADMVRNSRANLGNWTSTLETQHLAFEMDRSGATYFNQYLLIKSLGQGAHGDVKLCVNTTNGKLYAVKLINRKFQNRQLGKRRQLNPAANRQLREIAILKKMDHVNIVKLHEVIVADQSKYLMLVMEYAQNGPVIERIEDVEGQPYFARINENAARNYFRDMCSGLDYMHYHKIIHSDLKPENILIGSDGRVKLSDFGCSFVFQQRPDTTREVIEKGKQYGNIIQFNDEVNVASRPISGGSPPFHAPEMIEQREYNPYFTDLWALGVCLYCMTCGRLPFYAPSQQDLYNSIQNDPLTFPDDVDLSPQLKELLNWMLFKDPSARPTLQNIIQHPWVVSQDVTLQQLASLELPPQVLQTVISAAELEQAVIANDDSVILVPTNMHTSKLHFKDGEFLVKQGEVSNQMYFVVSGVVNMLLETDECTTNIATDGLHIADMCLPEEEVALFPDGLISPLAPVQNDMENTHVLVKGLTSVAQVASEMGTSVPATDAGFLGAMGMDDLLSRTGDKEPTLDCDLSELNERMYGFEVDGAIAPSMGQSSQVDQKMLLDGGNVMLNEEQAMEVFRRVQSNHLENAGHVVEQLGPGRLCGSIPGFDRFQLFSAQAQGDVEVLVLTQEDLQQAWEICQQQLQMRRIQSAERFRSVGEHEVQGLLDE